MPADRLKILREAFLKTMSDAEALAEAKNGGYDHRRKVTRRWSRNRRFAAGSHRAREEIAYAIICAGKIPIGEALNEISNGRKEHRGRKRIEVAGRFQTRYFGSRFLRAE